MLTSRRIQWTFVCLFMSRLTRLSLRLGYHAKIFHQTQQIERQAHLAVGSFRLFNTGEPNAVAKEPKKKGKPAEQVAPTKTLEELRQVRIDKIEALKQQGMNPFAYTFTNTHTTEQLQIQHANLANGTEDESAQVSLAGRVMVKRVFGKLAFYELQDATGTIQLYIDKKRLEDRFDLLRDLVDAGDIIGVEGIIKRTDKGELSIYVTSWTMLTKSLLPLPDKFKGLVDVNKRYRQRHLDMIASPVVRQVLRTRAKIISTIRNHLDDNGFVEIETPILQSQPGGAEARPFKTHHNSLDMDMTLRIATELHLKRLVVGGFDRVYELGRIFRNEGLSTRHNPEFTTVELYAAYQDYEDMMKLVEVLISNMAKELNNGQMKIDYQGEEIDLSPPWRRASMSQLVKEATGLDFTSSINEQDLPTAKSLALSIRLDEETRNAVGKAGTAGEVLNALFESFVEEGLRQPTFVTEHPVDISPLAKPHRDVVNKKRFTERFELFIVGREHANAFSELTDPLDQRQRFQAQAAKKAAGDEEACDVDEEFLTALESGMPPTAGMGIGIDRVVMLLTNQPAIRDVIAFPALRKET